MAKREPLTERTLRTWIAEGAPIAGRSDGGGLTFTLSHSGVASWTFRYRFGGKQRELTLGGYPAMGLAVARKIAREARVKVDLGVDVALEKQRAKLEARRQQSFRSLSEDYMRIAARSLAPKEASERQRFLDKDILPRLGNVPASDVTSGDVVGLVEHVAKRSDSVARRVFGIVGLCYAHGLAKGIVASNPCAGLKLSAILGARPPKRVRIMLTEDEIRDVLRALPAIVPTNALALRILLATGVRKGELERARREHVDLEAATWRIPDENSKTGRGFVVPLAPQVVGYFRALFALRASEWVLPGQKAKHHISHTTLAFAIDRLVEGLPSLRRFTPHDLRSTCRSFLTSDHVGASVIVAERCLNHALPGMLEIYDQNDYLLERRHALELWASFLTELEAGRDSNVRPLRVAV